MTALGRAHGRLPGDASALGQEHHAFLDRAVEALAQDGRVVCVRLVLLAELLRSRPWVPATLAELGGARAIGVMILDEAFSVPQAPPQNRMHRRAAQEVLKQLLPEGGALIKGHMSSRSALLDASGYSAQPREFQELLWILDHELRLVTPADPQGRDPEGGAAAAEAGPQYYQLAHDYLIPDLREWLFRDRQKSLRGRAELRLQEFASVWSERHKDKFLPSAWEWAALRCLTDRRRWSPLQRSMMTAASGRHARGALAALALVAAIGLSVFWVYMEFRARSLVERLKSADIGQVLRISREIGPIRRWALPLLRREAAQEHDPRARLRASLALVPDDPGQVDYLVGRMLVEDPVTSLTIREALSPFRGTIVGGLWEVAQDSRRPVPDRLRAALALCLYDPPPDGPGGSSGHRAWDEIAGSTADAVVATLDANPAVYATLVEAVQPIRSALIPRLKEYTVDPTCPAGVVTWASAIDYCEWLDGREGVRASAACYARGGDRFAFPLPLPDLAKSGYRLPTRAEWEFASLAGATTLRYYGDDDTLLDHYAWFFHPRMGNTLHPVGRLLPNDFGLFDVYGGVAEWNADVFVDGKQVLTSGGSYHTLPEGCDSRKPDLTLPGLEYDRYGFRIARTIELDVKGEATSF